MFRVDPAGPVQAYKTYEVRAPRATHWRPATCAEVDCPNYLHGWRTILPAGSDLVDLVRHSGRSYVETRAADGLVTFTFEAGQQCFAASTHQVPLDRPGLHLVRGGDWRADLGTIRQHVRPEDWVDDFATHQQQIADAVEKG